MRSSLAPTQTIVPEAAIKPPSGGEMSWHNDPLGM